MSREATIGEVRDFRNEMKRNHSLGKESNVMSDMEGRKEGRLLLNEHLVYKYRVDRETYTTNMNQPM